MRTVSRYLLTEFALASTAVFLALLVTWVAADTLLHIDRVSADTGEGFAGVLFRALDIFPLGIPMACVVGAVWSLTRAVRFREITAIRAGGIPLRTALLPLLGFTLLVSGGLALFEDRMLVPARRTLLDAGADGASDQNLPQQLGGRWWHSSGPWILSAREYVPATSELYGVTAFELGADRRVSRRVDASIAINAGGSVWEFRDATVRDFPVGGGVQQSVGGSFEADLGVTGGDLSRAAPPLEATTLHRLARRIRDFQGNANERAALESAFHRRLGQPLAVVILVLLALPFAIGDVERGDSLPRALLQSLAIAAAFWLVWTLSALVSGTGIMPAAIPPWTALAAFALLGLWRFRSVSE